MSTSPPALGPPRAGPHLVIRVNSDHSSASKSDDGRYSTHAGTPVHNGPINSGPLASPSAVHGGAANGGGIGKRDTPGSLDDEIDELQDDPSPPPPPPPPRTAPPPPVNPSPKPHNSGSKSRKSSCDLCHHRKIKCDQVRPSCSSCLRKGHPCHYSEETEANNPAINRRAAANAAAAVQGSSVETPRPVHSQQARGVFGPGAGTAGSSPGWMSNSSKPKGIASRPNSAAGGSAERSKKRLDRERIVNGYGSSSDEGEGDGSVRSKTASRAVDNDLADMLGEPPAKGDEIDELESNLEEDPRLKKREASVDDEISGELLELASAPPKKKKPRPSLPLPEPVPQRAALPSRPPRPQPHSHLSATSLPHYASVSAFSTATAAAPSSRYDAYSVPLVTLMASLPSNETQSILLNSFFSDPFLTEGISLLRPQFIDDFHSLVERRSTNKLREGDATTLANAFTFLAVALRVLPEETSKLLLSTSAASAPRSVGRIIANQPASTADPTPLDQRYIELALLAAQIAEQRDAPSVMYVVHKLVLFRYATLGFRKDRVVLAGGWLAQAIKTAQALGMSKEWEGIPQGERELRRRVMWSLYVADRQFAFDTAFPYTIHDAHQGIHLPSPISETDLYKIPHDSPTLPPHSTEAGPTECTALFIHTHLARRITPILDSFVTVGPSATPHELVLRFDASLDTFQDALPPYLRLFPLTDTRFDSAHPYLAPHRVRLHSTLLAYRLGVHRAHLAGYLSPSSTPGVRAVIAQVCLASIRCQKSAKMLDPKLSHRLFSPNTVFEAAATLSLIMHVERAVAGPTGSQQIAMSSEYLAMRAGVADGSELLDSISASSEQGEFACRAVGILREVILKVDAGPRAAPLGMTSPVTKTGAVNGSPANGGDAGVNGSNSDHGSPSGRDGSPVPNRTVVAISQWLDSWRAASINIDYLLREADGPSWERVITGM